MNGQEPVVLNSEQALRLRDMLWSLRMRLKGQAVPLGALREVAGIMDLLGMGDARKPMLVISHFERRHWIEELCDPACSLGGTQLDEYIEVSRLLDQEALSAYDTGKLEGLIYGLAHHFEERECDKYAGIFRKIGKRLAELDETSS